MVLDSFYDLGNLSWEGETFTVDLVNDTTEPLQFLQCADDYCESFARAKRVDPRESHPIAGTVDVLSWWQVQDEAGHVLGCFRIDFSQRPRGLELRASELRSCP